MIRIVVGVDTVDVDDQAPVLAPRFELAQRDVAGGLADKQEVLRNAVARALDAELVQHVMIVIAVPTEAFDFDIGAVLPCRFEPDSFNNRNHVHAIRGNANLINSPFPFKIGCG